MDNSVEAVEALVGDVDWLAAVEDSEDASHALIERLRRGEIRTSADPVIAELASWHHEVRAEPLPTTTYEDHKGVSLREFSLVLLLLLVIVLLIGAVVVMLVVMWFSASLLMEVASWCVGA
jgi:hypothetical protein